LIKTWIKSKPEYEVTTKITTKKAEESTISECRSSHGSYTTTSAHHTNHTQTWIWEM